MAGVAVDRGSAAPAHGTPLSWRDGILAWGTYERFLSVLLLLIVFVTCGLTPMQTDTWWQLRAGRDMWVSGRVLLSDIYSHTAQGSYWVNHEWLAELAFYLLYKGGGYGLLTVFCAVLITAGWMFSWMMREGAVRTAFILYVLALVSSSGWWEPRPHAFSLLFIPWTVYLLQRGTLRFIPFIFLVWANCHGGVLLGLVLVAAASVARALANRSEWRHGVWLVAACAIAMTLTPLGLHFWTEIPRSLGRINEYTLDEWSRPSLAELQLLPFWITAAGYVVTVLHWIRTVRSVSPSEAALNICALVLLAGALGAVRNVGPFLMLAVPALTRAWAHRESGTGGAVIKTERRGLNLAVLTAAAGAVILTLTTAYREAWPRLKWDPVPAAALSELEGCRGNLYNRYDEGGYLLWFAPGRPVFLDGRQDPFPQALVLEHIEMETGARDYKATFDRHDIRCAFLPVASPVAKSLMTANWTQLYRDSQWIVFRKG